MDANLIIYNLRLDSSVVQNFGSDVKFTIMAESERSLNLDFKDHFVKSMRFFDFGTLESIRWKYMIIKPNVNYHIMIL